MTAVMRGHVRRGLVYLKNEGRNKQCHQKKGDEHKNDIDYPTNHQWRAKKDESYTRKEREDKYATALSDNTERIKNEVEGEH